MFEGIRCNPELDEFLALDRRACETPDALAILAPDRDPIAYRDLWKHVIRCKTRWRDMAFSLAKSRPWPCPANPSFSPRVSCCIWYRSLRAAGPFAH